MRSLPEWMEIRSEHIDEAKSRTLLKYARSPHYSPDDVRMYDAVLQSFQSELRLLLEEKLGKPYDPKFGDERVCECGHTYERHFDWMEDYRPGCKYCPCIDFQEQV